MRGFVELQAELLENKILINVNNIVSVYPLMDCDKVEITFVEGYCENLIFEESYSEVLAKISEATK